MDGITKAEYEKNLEANVQNLLGRLKRKACRPLPVRRVYIPKPGSAKMRPLGIPAYEDKLVQLAVSKILNAIYEADFLDTSFGFRPGRGSHDALKLLNYLFITKKIDFVVDADIKGFFDHVNHDWLMKFLGHRIADTNLLRLIRRFLKAGIMENGELREATEGTPQGGIIHPSWQTFTCTTRSTCGLRKWFANIVAGRLTLFGTRTTLCAAFNTRTTRTDSTAA